MFRKRATEKVDKSLSASVDYEVTLTELVRRSERRAWFVAFSAILMALILAGGYFLVLPLKERVPFLVMADAYTGTATVARLRGSFGNNSITANEAVNRSNLARYVRARESYDIAQRDIRDWNVIFTMSTPEVANAYKQETYNTRNPDSLYSKYGSSTAIQVEIISITLLDSTRDATEAGAGGGDAAVRFQRVRVEKAGGNRSVLDTRIANIRYNYNKGLALDEKLRWENPLGFQVTSYRVDTEQISIPVQPPSMTGQGAQAGAAAPQTQTSTMSQQQAPAIGNTTIGTPAVPADPQQQVPQQVQSPQPAEQAETNGVNTQ